MRPMLSVPAPADYLALKYPIAAEIKHDGVRCIATVESGKVKLYSRSGRFFDNFKEIADLMKKYQDGVYDGEVISPDGFDVLMTRANAKKGTNNQVKIEYKIFDKLTIDEWNREISHREYRHRCIEAGIGERTIITNAVDLDYYFKYVVKQGKEGLILKPLDGLYVAGKSSYWMKLKVKDTIDMTIYACEEGIEKGTLGAFHCRAITQEGHPVFSNVAVSNHKQKKEFWDDRVNMIGKTIEVEYQELTKFDGAGHRSLRLPIFKCIRIDK